MQRFAIKIDKTVKARLKNLCRLCGIGSPNQVDILNAAEWIDLTIDDEVPLSRKIIECVGIEVLKNDKMPQQICPMCVDKINDFYEFREMCQATNVQTRKLLNLPSITKIKAPKKVTIKTDDDAVESILGISGTETKVKSEISKASKKSRKATTSTLTTTATATATATAAKALNENRFRGMTKREIEITLELERIKKEEEDEKMLIVADNPIPMTATTSTGRVVKYSRKKKLNAMLTLDAPLLAPKAPNQRERKREMDQKRIEKKRKLDTKIMVPASKKIKKEPGVSCYVCAERFEKSTLRDAHLQAMHRPTIFNYGCGTCYEQFSTLEECTLHNEWHWKNNIPHRCAICSGSFPKLINFQSHLLACVDRLFASPTGFAGNIFCGSCNLEFETQNLYDWHACFIGDNSRCPKCQRIFIKRTVLLKHMFKCTGLPSGTVATATTTAIAPANAPAKRSKGRPKKKTAAARAMENKAKNKLDISAQKIFKFEPETIIEQHGEGDDGGGDYDAADSFMDTHFADSDTEFEPSSSIITSTGLDMVNSEPQEPEHDNASINSHESQIPATVTSSVNVTANRSNIDVSQLSLLECRVKLEPLDVASLVPPSIPQEKVVHSEPVVEQQQQQRPLTVPPLTIRIKKEVIRPGYGDEFDMNLAHNIKQEKVDETYELLAGSSSASAQPLHSDVHKKSKHRDKEKKLYKKPALLAIKIKQERMEREGNDDENYGESYSDYSAPIDDYSIPSDVTAPTHSAFDCNPLPIITQIHSVIDAGATVTTDLPVNMVSQITNTHPVSSQPFIPIRIKSEFQRPLSPPLLQSEIINSTPNGQNPDEDEQHDNEELPDIEQQPNNADTQSDDQFNTETNEKTHSEQQINSTEQLSNEIGEITMEVESPHVDSIRNECLQLEHTADDQAKVEETVDEKENDEHASLVECKTNASLNGNNQMVWEDSVDSMAKNDNNAIVNQTDININHLSSASCTDATDDQPLQQQETCEKVEINSSQLELASEQQTSSVNEENAQLVHNNNAAAGNSDLELMERNIASTSATNAEPADSMNATDSAPIDINMEQIDRPEISQNFTGLEEHDATINTGLLQQINEISDVSIAAGTNVTNENSSISPIDFIENANDESLNFIDQLVHEVADKMVVPQANAMVCDAENNINASIPIQSTTDVSFMEFDYNVGCSIKSAEHNESDTQIYAGVARPTAASDTFSVLADIPDIDCDLLPVLNANEHTSNGNKLQECKSPTSAPQLSLPQSPAIKDISSGASELTLGYCSNANEIDADSNVQNEQPKLSLN